ncbi:SAM dependent carboxyl methyltransferase, partial [Corchorus olitorius]
GDVKEEDVDSFNFPFYSPCKEEITAIIEKEGSFEIKRLEVFEVGGDEVKIGFKDIGMDQLIMQKSIYGAKALRAVTEPLLSTHFGDAIMDKLFSRFATIFADHLANPPIGRKSSMTNRVNIVISLTKK